MLQIEVRQTEVHGSAHQGRRLHGTPSYICVHLPDWEEGSPALGTAWTRLGPDEMIASSGHRHCRLTIAQRGEGKGKELAEASALRLDAICARLATTCIFGIA